MSDGPVILSKMPREPSIDDSSRGELMAAVAAAIARLSPFALPVPIKAVPAFVKIILTSAKSVLMRPGVVIKLVIPATPCNSTSSARLNASSKLVFSVATDKSRSFGMMINVSTLSRNLAIPASACIARRRPSNPNGRVTMPTVNAPAARAISAMIGAAPVPVPPPSPAVMNTMSAPLTISSMSLRLASAASCPIAGSLPAPRPRVISRPMSILKSASLINNA